MGPADNRNFGAAAFTAKYHDVSKCMKDLHVEIEMFRVFGDDTPLLEKAATLAEVEQCLKAALTALRESDERRMVEQSQETVVGDSSRPASPDQGDGAR
jgi:hypothetical protein